MGIAHHMGVRIPSHALMKTPFEEVPRQSLVRSRAAANSLAKSRLAQEPCERCTKLHILLTVLGIHA